MNNSVCKTKPLYGKSLNCHNATTSITGDLLPILQHRSLLATSASGTERTSTTAKIHCERTADFIESTR